MEATTKLNFWWRTLPIIALLAIWEMIARLNLIPGGFFPPFSVVMVEAYRLITNGVLIRNFLSSLTRVLIGFFSGSIAGLVIGGFIGWKRIAHQVLHPIISLLYPIPALGWLPIFMLWFGIGELLPISIIFMCSFFPIVYNVDSGIRSVDKKFVKASKVLGANQIETLIQVVLPLALASIFTGLRLEAGMAWRVIIAAEMVAIPTGLGALLMRAETLIRMDIILVCLIVLSLMCLLFERFFLYLEQKTTQKWR